MSEQVNDHSTLRVSSSIATLAAAMAEFQGEVDAAPKDSVNPHFKSRYADLAACRETAREPLRKNGLVVVQAPLVDMAAGNVGVVTRVIHKSGEWIESEVWCRPKDLLAQSVGSAVTYLRRYAYCAMLGLVADIDDDAQSAQPQRPNDREPRRDAAPPHEPEQRQAAPRRAPAAAHPHANAKPREASIYTGESKQAKAIEGILEQRKVPKSLWGDIDTMLRDRPSNELWDIIKVVTQRAAAPVEAAREGGAL